MGIDCAHLENLNLLVEVRQECFQRLDNTSFGQKKPYSVVPIDRKCLEQKREGGLLNHRVNSVQREQNFDCLFR
jgi:hypothetical protein